MAGDNTKGHLAGPKTGHAAGNAWCGNNWNDVPIATGMTQDLARSTWGGGTGINVIYGVAAPVQPPKMGKVRRP